jgi:ferredoxin/flavodoxin---NADP+ reductase
LQVAAGRAVRSVALGGRRGDPTRHDLREERSVTDAAAGTTHDCDLLIIGAGPTGLYAAYYAGFRGMRVALIDSLPEPGGQVTALYPEKLIYDVAGFPAIKGQALIDNLVEQAGQFDPTYFLGHRAEDLHHTADGEHVIVRTHKDLTITCKAVVITGGIGTFTPRPLPDGEEFEGRGLRYFVPKLDALADLDVLIVGGGDSAFDWAHNLEGIARSITLIHRRDRFRAHERTVEQVMESSVDVRVFTEVGKIIGDGKGITEVEIFNNKTDERERIPVQAVVAALGFTADLGPLKTWGLEQEKRHILVDTTMRTNLDRVFAAGDITEYEGKVRLISVGFGEAATAVNNAAVCVDPEAKVFPGHSSDVK